MKFEELTEKIIGCAYEVYNQLNFGHLESVYEQSLLVELNRKGLEAEHQVPLSVCYKGENVGEFIADVIVDNKVILELKSVEAIHDKHEVQLVNYLTATEKDVGLLINFGPDGVTLQRKVRTLPDTD